MSRHLPWWRGLALSGVVLASHPVRASGAPAGWHHDPGRSKGLAAIPAPSSRFALLIGVSDYPGSAFDLDGGPLTDVGMMRELLVNRFGFSPANILVLLDQQGSRNGVIQAIRTHLGRAGRQGLALLYYSGHGIRLPDNRGLTGPDDPEPDARDETLALWGFKGDRFGYLLDDELGILLGETGAGRTVVILDQCNAGTATRGVSDSVLSWNEFGNGIVPEPESIRHAPLADSEGPRDKRVLWSEVGGTVDDQPLLTRQRVTATAIRPHLLLASSKADQPSFAAPVTLEDGRARRAGLFTAALYQALARSDSSTSMLAVMKEVREVVERVTRKTGQTTQSPSAAGPWLEESVYSILGVEGRVQQKSINPREGQSLRSRL